MAAMPPLTGTHGFSPEAEWIARTARSKRDRLVRTNWLPIDAAREELGAVWSECQTANWDGFGAVPVSPDALRSVDLFLASLPLDMPAPAIGAEPDGQLTLEWRRSARHTLSISVSHDRYLHYAALLGPNRKYGTVAFFGEVPTDILQLIEEVIGR